MQLFIFAKDMIKSLFKKNKVFLIPYASIFLIAFVCLLVYKKTDIHIFINKHNSVFFDYFFKYWTYLGDGIFAVLFTVFLLFIKYSRAIISGISLLLTALIVQILKHTFYADKLRPLMYFKTQYEGTYKLHLIQGAEPSGFFSFPSGHTASAFAIFFLAAIFTNNNFFKILFLIFALLVAYSRIYLSWHFLGDTLAGSLIGIITTTISYLFITKYKNIKLDKSLLKNK